jgi:hypothetical protein
MIQRLGNVDVAIVIDRDPIRIAELAVAGSF